MYPIKTGQIYVVKDVLTNSLARIRLDRMLKNINYTSIEYLSIKSLDALIKKENWGSLSKKRTGEFHRTQCPTLIFNLFRNENLSLKWKNIRFPNIKKYMFDGHGMITHRKGINHHGPDTCICQPADEIHSIFGCLHACSYCHVGNFINIMMNIEELIPRLKGHFESHPNQLLYKYDNLTDQIPFEPEYGASELLVPFFGKQHDKFLLLYTKSDNVDHLLDLPHNNQTIVNWTISTESQCKLVENFTPDLNARIRAMQKCQDSGYHVRARFSPLIPLNNWEVEIPRMVDLLFAKVKPDSITIDVIGFMSPRQMLQCIPISLFSVEAADHLRKLKSSGRIRWGKLVFPHEFRKKMFDCVINSIKSHDPSIPIAICNESREMWEVLKQELFPMDPKHYYCCCGPTSVPSNRF